MKALIISVGGSPAPVLHSINSQMPDYLILFASASSRCKAVEEVLPALSCTVKDREFIITPDEQDLVASVKIIHQRLPEVLTNWKLDYKMLTADYTGGTKTMSSALVLALHDRIRTFSYVGGVTRDKEGLGVVINGSEQMLHQKNPSDELATERLGTMSLLFNRCRFQSVSDIACSAAALTDSKRPMFKALQVAADAFYLWDNFHYDTALKKLNEAESKLGAVSADSEDQNLQLFTRELLKSVKSLEQINTEMNLYVKSSPSKHSAQSEKSDGMAIICDLISNARRRAEGEFKYDDAVARLYSAIEKMAKVRLKAQYSIDNSDVAPASIPEGEFRDKILAECRSERDGKSQIQIPLHRSYEFLHILGDQLGAAYQKYQDELGKVLSTRNMSLLAHGFNPVREDTYRKLLSIALSFLSITEDRLPRFPVMGWK